MTEPPVTASEADPPAAQPPNSPRDREQAATTRRYDRNARIYDLYDTPMDLLGGVRRRRRRLLGEATGRTLEVGVGTGRNLDLYPDGTDLTGIDISTGMLSRARRRATRLDLDGSVKLEQADIGQLPYADASFDTATATCVFCSVADPVSGLGELARVVRPDGQVLLLEHVRPRNAVVGWMFDLVNPIARRLVGANINRPTEHNVAAAGLEIVEVRRAGVWREIHAVPVHPAAAPSEMDQPEIRQQELVESAIDGSKTTTIGKQQQITTRRQ